MVDKDVWVQPIVVADDLSHEEAIWYGASASAVFMRLDGVENLAEWIFSGMRKTVRRASKDKMRKLSEDDMFLSDGCGLAGPPMKYGDFPPLLKRMQVSGTDFARDQNRDLYVTGNNVFVLDTLTTGKATAQAAHALWLSGLDLSNEDFEVLVVDADELVRLAASPDVVSVVRDAGHTEVESGTLTAVMISE